MHKKTLKCLFSFQCLCLLIFLDFMAAYCIPKDFPRSGSPASSASLFTPISAVETALSTWLKICRAVIKQDISLCLKFIVTVPEIEPHWFAFKSIDLVADISLRKFCTVQLKKSLLKFLRMAGKSRREHIRHTDLVCGSKKVSHHGDPQTAPTCP